MLRAVEEDLETSLLKKADFSWPNPDCFAVVDREDGVKADCWGAAEKNRWVVVVVQRNKS